MARETRQSFSALIEVYDLKDNQSRADRAVDNGISVKVWNRKQGPFPSKFRQVHDLFDEKIREAGLWAKKNAVTFNHSIAYRLTEFVENAKATDYEDEDGFRKIRKDQIVKNLQKPGCRVWLTQTEMAEKLGCSRSTLTSTLRALKAVDLIINWGEGWIEFDCFAVWRGDVGLKLAYERKQEVHSSKRITIVNSMKV